MVTYYTFFAMIPKGKHPISVCMGTVCRVRGSEKLPEEFKRILGIEAGETTPDGKFFPDCLWCVGAYGLPPCNNDRKSMTDCNLWMWRRLLKTWNEMQSFFLIIKIFLFNH